LRGTSTRKVFPITGTNGKTTATDRSVLAADYRYDEGLRIRKSGVSPTLEANNHNIYAVLTPDRIEKRQNGRRFKKDGEPMFTLTSQDRHGIMLTRNEIKSKTETSHCLMARDYKGIGNQEMTAVLEIKEATKKGYAEAEPGDSVNYSVPTSKTRRGRVGKNIANTLDTGVQQGVVTEDIRIRKLTPRECFRLQGFPDELFDKAQKVNSDSQLYKQAGNSVTVNVIYEIAKKLKEHKHV